MSVTHWGVIMKGLFVAEQRVSRGTQRTGYLGGVVTQV